MLLPGFLGAGPLLAASTAVPAVEAGNTRHGGAHVPAPSLVVLGSALIFMRSDTGPPRVQLSDC